MFIITELGPIGALLIGGTLALALLCFALSGVLEVFAGDEGRIEYRTGALSTLMAGHPFTETSYVNGIDAKVFFSMGRLAGIGVAVTPEALHLTPLLIVRRGVNGISGLRVSDHPLQFEKSYLARHLSTDELTFYKARKELLIALKDCPTEVATDESYLFADRIDQEMVSSCSAYLIDVSEKLRR